MALLSRRFPTFSCGDVLYVIYIYICVCVCVTIIYHYNYYYRHYHRYLSRRERRPFGFAITYSLRDTGVA